MPLEEKIQTAYCKMFGNSSYEGPEQAFDLILNELQALHWMKDPARVQGTPGEGTLVEELDHIEKIIAAMGVKIQERKDADAKALKMWARSHPAMNLPDHADLCLWLLGQLEEKS